MKIFRKALFIGGFSILAAVLHYALPQVDVVRAVGVETKRVDQSRETGETTTRDVYYVQTEQLDSSSPSVFRNEDNLIYLKWNSADIQAKVQSLAKDKQTIAVQHYGWRIRLISMFPNTLDVWVVDEDYRHVPVFNMIILTLLAAIGFLSYRKVRSFGRRIETRKRSRARSSNDQAETRSDLDDFLSDDDGDD
ncbi:DUF1523 family protein [Pseudosulfitobacter pseudonitzschiae]|uniref:DUF1523 family protein n=1 Tax=Pseudosulfitobacter pseudonitzschiae TaxID=1402135 RepID=UPI003B7E6DBE